MKYDSTDDIEMVKNYCYELLEDMKLTLDYLNMRTEAVFQSLEVIKEMEDEISKRG